MTNDKIVKDLVLVGGGHSHAIALRMFAMNPMPDLRLTLISDVAHAPYSGMLPGHVAGFYSYDDCHIDLRQLANFAGARLFLDRVVGLDLAAKRVLCAHRPPVAFDLLSINIGSSPAMLGVPGAAVFAIPAKPVPQFLRHWQQLLQEIEANPTKPVVLGIVGGGAGGVELALAMQGRLQSLAHNIKIHLFHSGKELLPNHNRYIKYKLQKILIEKGIELHLETRVVALESAKNEGSGEEIWVVCEQKPGEEPGPGFWNENDGQRNPVSRVPVKRVFWVTQASAPGWIRESGLVVDGDGFIEVRDTLQSVSHNDVFAAGDIATVVNNPRPKAGVFAVRQGKPLFENLRRVILGRSLQKFRPQKHFLALIGTGTGEALASRGAPGIGTIGMGPSRLLWRWKDWIDRRFMAQFSQLPDMSVSPQPPFKRGAVEESPQPLFKRGARETKPQMHCAGCGAKVGSTTLGRVLQRLNSEFVSPSPHPPVSPSPRLPGGVVIGLSAPDDCAVVQVRGDKLMLHTVDYFPALIDDPFVFGQIAANHSLGDIFAMGGTPETALAIATIPYATEAEQEETLYQLLAGALKILNQTQTSLVGGHTIAGPQLAFGLACNGLVAPDKLLRKGGMQPEQLLIITKPLGTGTLFAADMRRQAKGRWIENAIASMLIPNHHAAACLGGEMSFHPDGGQGGATACTDVTGFGLLGHLLEMVTASGVAVELNLRAIPVLDGALATVEKGILSTLHPENFRAAAQIHNLAEVEIHPLFPLLFDPQTAGGLLASVPPESANALVAKLQSLGYCHSQIIGRVVSSQEGMLPVRVVS